MYEIQEWFQSPRILDKEVDILDDIGLCCDGSFRLLRLMCLVLGSPCVGCFIFGLHGASTHVECSGL